MKKKNDKGQTLEEFLAHYNPADFRHPAVTADCLLLYKGCEGIKVLMIKRGNHPCIDMYALPGGFCEYGESSEDTAARELYEETGCRTSLRQLCFVSTPDRDPRDWIMTVIYIGITDTLFAAKGGDDAASAHWLDVKAEYDGDTAVLTLSGQECASAVLTIARDAFGKIDLNKTMAEGNIAFDHAKIILYGLESISG